VRMTFYVVTDRDGKVLLLTPEARDASALVDIDPRCTVRTVRASNKALAWKEFQAGRFSDD